MNVRFLIYKSKGNSTFHARFIIGEADSGCENVNQRMTFTDITAVLCMDTDNKKFTPFI